jgi:hypothetical protein
MAEEAREQGRRRLALVQARIKARLDEESREQEKGDA